MSSEKTVKAGLNIKSVAFEDGKNIPLVYSHTNAGGKNKSIPVSWTGVPENSKSLTLLVYDIHPVAHDFVHWLVTGITPDTKEIKDGASGTAAMPAGAIELGTSYGNAGYGGPCPPKGSGKHEYRVILYALNTDKITVKDPVSYAAIVKALEGKVIEQVMIKGYYER